MAPIAGGGGPAADLRSVAVFEAMADADLIRLAAGGTVLEARDGTMLFEQGDRADAVYAIVGGEGSVRIGSVDRRSKALMVEVLSRGEIFGEIGVIAETPRTAAAVAIGRIRLVRIPAQGFLDALTHSPAMGTALSTVMARRLARTFALFQDATFETLDVRLARQVLYLAEREGRPTSQGLRLSHRFRQGDLADLLGVTTRSIITILNGWRASNIVSYDTDRALLTLCDIPALRAIVAPNDPVP